MALSIPGKPELNLDQARAILHKYSRLEAVALIGIRGYFEKGGNKRDIYDDAIFLISPGFLGGFNANTDPSVTRPGIAVLQPGVYIYAQGIHGVHHLNTSDPKDKALMDLLVKSHKDLPPDKNGRILPYWALRQYGNVTVKRDGQDDLRTDSPQARFWIDIHRGGYNTTSSDGCQTIQPDQWGRFRQLVFSEMDKAQQRLIPYILIQNSDV